MASLEVLQPFVGRHVRVTVGPAPSDGPPLCSFVGLLDAGTESLAGGVAFFLPGSYFLVADDATVTPNREGDVTIVQDGVRMLVQAVDR